MPRTIARHRAGIALAAFATLCGIAVHLIAELAALGWQDDAALICSPRHAVLGLLALAALGALTVAAWGARHSGTHGVRMFAGRLAAPTDGRVVAVSFLMQLAVFGVTELGEGAPLTAGDAGLGLLCAVISGAVAAYFVARFHARVLHSLAVTFAFLSPALTHDHRDAWRRADAHVRVWRSRAITFSASLRPPPHLPAH